ncbi:MAG: SDR family oxidoreductase [Phycisphaerae bacterium]|nr:SDR family oxidoreductase [Phycisphaerae bacterium]
MTETSSNIGSDRPVALITGASAGIGRTFARRLAERGYDLILVARRQERLDELADDLRRQFDVAAEAIAADLTTAGDLQKVARRIAESSRFEFLVNNAGFGTLPLFAETDIESQDAMARLHVLAPMHLAHAALPGMIQRHKGFIVNVASVAGFFQSPANVMYCSTKAWLSSFTEGLAVELNDTGVVVQALCPGFTYSEFHDVLGVDRAAVPKHMWLRADVVVNQSLKALARGKVICIPTLQYKFYVLISRILPRFLRNHIARKRHTHLKKHEIKSQM